MPAGCSRSPPGAQSWCDALSPTPAGISPHASARLVPGPAGPPRRRRPSPVPPRSPKPGRRSRGQAGSRPAPETGTGWAPWPTSSRCSRWTARPQYHIR